MDATISDLQDIERLYLLLERHLEEQYKDLVAQRPPRPDQGGETASLERRILQAERLLAGLFPAGSTEAAKPDTERSNTAACSASLKKRAQHLLELLQRNSAQVLQLRNEAQAGLRELRRGECFLQGVRGYRENQPRFLDSCQ